MLSMQALLYFLIFHAKRNYANNFCYKFLMSHLWHLTECCHVRLSQCLQNIYITYSEIFSNQFLYCLNVNDHCKRKFTNLRSVFTVNYIFYDEPYFGGVIFAFH